MKALKDFPSILNNIRTSKKNRIEALHKFVYESEGDRNNRKRLREFCGFDFNKNTEEFIKKQDYVTRNLSHADLVSICILLGINYEGADLTIHIFDNLIKGELLPHAFEDQDDEYECDDDDEDGAGEVSANNDENNGFGSAIDDEGEDLRSATTINQRRVFNQRGVENCTANIQRFSLNFRDVEDTICKYDGSYNVSIKVWIEEFEEMSIMMNWDELQKTVYAKRSVTGLAKMFIDSTQGLNTWPKIKNALSKEFARKLDSGQLHKTLTEQKMQKTESVLEYFYRVKKIASQGYVEDSALFNYVIDGIQDLHINKTMLYGARNLEEFKMKLGQYELFSSKQKTHYESRTNHNKPSKVYTDNNKKNYQYLL